MDDILDHQVRPDGSIWYRIKWANYPVDDATWEPESNINTIEIKDGPPVRPSRAAKRPSQETASAPVAVTQGKRKLQLTVPLGTSPVQSAPPRNSHPYSLRLKAKSNN
ncbi:hypothetical protein BCR44DRAFT_1435848 [Catenaria anguillulae PL171]|uniref:Chromo domain-containing protein n=1 Tax=Catenaria anguillulae PL171 TaxID=765915 RepID=A0A1Y2HM83_9FUNG|nr:hypothetical protein BCR44DRAFT_1435848 [Catenaria anguillulae PL171]